MNNRHDKILFWGCFIAIITTSYAFISRIILCTSPQFATDFGLDKVMVGGLVGAGIWPFGVSIIVFSLFIDRIGYKVAMIFSFVCYLIYTALAFAAYNSVHGVTGQALVDGQKHGYQLIYWGSIILGLGNGSVEAYANPIVTTMFNTDKTKWLNRLHAGWPGGLVLGGLCTIALAANTDWRIILGLILIPAFIFFWILASLKIPRSEREQAGVSYLAMLKELGAFGALVGFGLVFAQLFQVLVPTEWKWPDWVFWIPTAFVVFLFTIITKSFGRGILAFLIIIMMPQAIIELGTDGWITSLMQTPMQAAGYNPAWVLVYTSAIMVVLRFCAGPLVHKLSPLGLLATCSALAAIGLFALSKTNGAGIVTIFAAATLYGVGKTFFWPTILGLTSEQCPKGGALTLNADWRHRHACRRHSRRAVHRLHAGIFSDQTIGNGKSRAVSDRDRKKNYLLGAYQAIDPVKSSAAISDADHKRFDSHDCRPVQRARQNGDVPHLHLRLLPRVDRIFQIQRRLQAGAVGFKIIPTR